MTTDLTFITNEEGKTLLERFKVLIKNTKFLDCLVGYFYTSGFYSIYPSLESTEKIRILIGINTNSQTYHLIEKAQEAYPEQLTPTTRDIKENYSKQVEADVESAQDTQEVENGMRIFIDWIKSKKLELRAYPERDIHAKLYIMTFQEGGPDDGRVITGSSNFTKAGLVDNLEFNVELKNSSDYHFAQKKFNELWELGVNVTNDYVKTAETKTWLNDTITPYELYLKFLYEYLKEKINLDKEELSIQLRPQNFKELEYQKDAVRDAKVKLQEYGGVFISDVVGLGKTYITAMLVNELNGRTLVIAPPVLLDESNPGSWKRVFYDFGVRQAKFESIGKLDKIIDSGIEYENVVIDESHRFRNPDTQMYSQLFEICMGKRVILVSATPLNNSPLDILSQIRLFQNVHKSTLPNPKVKDLEAYFNLLQKGLKDLDRKENKEEYLKIVKSNSEDIRTNILQYLMVRRTRNNIEKYYSKDLKKQKLRFPDVDDPEPIIYSFDPELDKIFNRTMDLIINHLRYSRYSPLLYLKEGLEQPVEVSQKNMRKFMKILLLKRLESSFFAFKQTLDRFIHSYDNFINEYQKGNVYVSKKYTTKIFELIDEGDFDSVQEILDKENATVYKSSLFKDEFKKYLDSDYEVLKELKLMWEKVNKDPKLDKFINMLSKDQVLKKNKLVVFTESKETGFYLKEKLEINLKIKVLNFSSESGEPIRQEVMANFDAKSKVQKNDYRILISTDILSEGVNLHRSNVVINYDIPWNPIRMMQRVGRINRVDTSFDKIYTYNFFPAGPINENIKLKEAAQVKINAFIEMLGNDARLLTDEEIKSHDLFTKLTSKKTIIGEEEEDYELKYLSYLREIRDNNKELFEKIKNLPKKSRTAKKTKINNNKVLTFFRKGKLRKIYITEGKKVEEIDFPNGAKILEAESTTKKESIGKDFYIMLNQNKTAFELFFQIANAPVPRSIGRSRESKLSKILNAIKKDSSLIEDDQTYILDVLDLLRNGSIDPGTIKRILTSIEKERELLKILAKIKTMVPSSLFKRIQNTNSADTNGPKEVILSEYLIGSG